VANRTVIVGMMATFVGLTALLVVAGVVIHPILLAVAVPFGVVAYLLWYHASGRLRDRVRREAERADPTERERARRRAEAAGNRRDAYRTAGVDAGGPRGANGGPRGANGAGDPRDRAPTAGGMSEREAYETLGLDPGADRDAIRSTYRERAKRLHPDGDDGDEEAFKRLTRAYEALTE
jgi:hypothetical protein